MARNWTPHIPTQLAVMRVALTNLLYCLTDKRAVRFIIVAHTYQPSLQLDDYPCIYIANLFRDLIIHPSGGAKPVMDECRRHKSSF